MKANTLKNTIYGGLYTIIGGESLLIGTKVYEMIKNNSMFTIKGLSLCPNWFAMEILMIGFAPLLTKQILNLKRNNSSEDQSNIQELIKSINEKSEK
ncbi:hypothetical protein DVV91_17185 [Clostridium botulinum]|uniref:hypothetical protein n=1 Tax=Clostridium botulinum TaxID=1491 RepID=UPI00196871C0|nr:hypothetical protein [Clostridium botulinum]MBN1076056.1 hypothetical protein [Clostridium botulinum]